MAASTLDGEITFFSETRGDKITFVAKKRQSISIGSNPTCDVRIFGAKDVHVQIQLDQTGKVKATNLSEDHPILINGEEVIDKKTLKSGDVISIMNHQLRWDTKAELRRRTAALTKSARKEAKHRVIRTNKRLTIHNLASSKQEDVSVIEKIEEIPEKNEQSDPVTPPNNENNANNSKLSLLNLSGTLITSFTPTKSTTRSSLRTTPLKNTPVETTTVLSTPKSVLNESSNLNRSSMHLVDLIGTPMAKKTPKTPKRTPLSVKKTPSVRTASKNETLLKSAIKNSSIKKRINDTQPQSAAKGKVLFQSPILDVSNASSSVVSVSFASAEGQNSPNKTIDDSAFKMEVTEPKSATLSECSHVSQDGSESDEETKVLLDSITSILDENEIQTPPKCKTPLIESDKTPDVERNFNQILEDTTIPPVEQIESDFKNIEEKKAESLLNWIETTRETLANSSEPNNTEQVLSSRYSNVTPNDSVVTTVAYDAKTPKMSILEAVQDVHKSAELAMSPTTRLSFNGSSTVVENFALNSGIKKSFRSTRKHIGSAMSSLQDTSLNPNSTFDETLNASQQINSPAKNESIMEASTTNILSLDDQPPVTNEQSFVDRDENAENIPPSTSNNFIDFANYDNDDTEKEFFEISNSEIDENDLQEEVEESSSSSDEEQDSEDEIEEIVGSSQEADQSKNADKPKDVALKFRLSEQDLEEDGINPLDISARTDDNLNESVNNLEDNVNNLNEQNNEPVHENEHIEIPATQNMDDIEIPATEDVLTDQMNEMMDGNCSFSVLDSKTEEVESIIEEHLESSNVSQRESSQIVQEEHLDDTNNILSVNSQVEIENPVTIVNSQENESTSMIVEALETSEVQESQAQQSEIMDDIEIPCTQAIESTSSAETISDEQSEIQCTTSGETVSEELSTVIEATKSNDTLNNESGDENDEMMGSEEIDAESQVDDEITKQNDSIELFATQAEDYNIVESKNDQEMLNDEASIIDESVQETSIVNEQNIPEMIENEQSITENIDESIQQTPIIDESIQETPIIDEQNIAEETSIDIPEEIEQGESLIQEKIETPTIESELKSIFDTPDKDESENIAESPKTTTVLEPINDESISIKISVSVEEKIQENDAIVEPENVTTESPYESKQNEIIDDSNINLPTEELPQNQEINKDSGVNDELADITEQQQNEETREPVVEEPCVKKFAYQTTDDDDDQKDESSMIQEEIRQQVVEEKLEAIIETSTTEQIEESSKIVEPERIIEPPVEQTIAEPEIDKKPEDSEIKTSTESLDVPQEVVKEQKETLIEAPTPRRRARVNYLELAGSPAKTPSRRGRSASIEGNNVQSTPKPPRSARKIMPAISEKSPTIKNESEPQKESEDLPINEMSPIKHKDLEVPTKLRRGRSASVDVKPVPVKESHVEQSENVKKRGGRRRVASESVDIKENPIEEPPKKKARGKRAATEETESQPVEMPVEKVEKKTKGKAAAVKEIEPTKDETPVKRGRGRAPRHKSPEKESEHVATESEKVDDHIEQPKKKGRGRKVATEEAESRPIESPVEKIEKKARGKHAATNEDEHTKEETPVKRGRGRAPRHKSPEKQPEDIVTESETAGELVEPEKEQPKKKGRGRQAAEPKQAESPVEKVEKKARGKAAADQTKKDETPVKRGRGRAPRNKSPEKEPEESESEKVDDHVEPVKEQPKKKGRGRRAATEEPEPQPIEVPVEKKSRGKRAAVKEPEPEIEEVQKEEPPTKKSRGRKKAEEVPVESESQPVVVETKKGRGKKAKEVEPETIPEEVLESPKTLKGRGRKKVVEKVVEEPSVPTKKRGRVAKLKESEEIVEISSQESTETPKKRTKAKHVTIVTPSTELLAKSQASTSGANDPAPKSNSRKRQAQPELPTVSEEPTAKRSTRAKKK